MRVDLGLDQHQLPWPELQRRARFAEDAGFDGIWVFDHFKALYGPAEGPCFEAWTLLAGLAAVTTRVRLGPLVTGVTYRHPSVLAAEVVTVDHLSNGRVELGMGAAWFAQEHEELGIDVPSAGERIGRLEEAIQVMTTLMTEKDASFDGRYYRLDHATYRPLAVQQPHPPVWVGGGGERRTMPLAARRADVWHGFGTVAEVARKSQILDRLAVEAGRDPSAIRRSTSLNLSNPWDQVRAIAQANLDAGLTILIADWPSEGWSRVEEFAEQVQPDLHQLA